ncbi:prophage repressor [Pandoraea communis]|uniref:Prophage repressor n=2 Tax=Pandoraea communis TaxID=2508297 RepID=A0A5E4TT28_9BURK|nr:prophage repressor [Pandoraea communis]
MGGKEGALEEFAYPVGFGDGYVEYPSSDPHVYALRVRGDSMHPRYRAGEFVVIEPSIEPQDGDDVVVICVDGRKLLKQLNWLRDDELQLLSINNGYAPLTLKRSDVHSLQLVAGRARRSAFMKT